MGVEINVEKKETSGLVLSFGILLFSKGKCKICSKITCIKVNAVISLLKKLMQRNTKSISLSTKWPYGVLTNILMIIRMMFQRRVHKPKRVKFKCF